MRMVMACIRDAAAEAWHTPLFFMSKGQAVRSFADAVNDGKSDFWKHPEDFALFQLGWFDQGSGAVELCFAPESLALAVNLKSENK